MLNVLRGTAEFQINCLGLHGNDRTRTRDHGLLESLAAVDAALSEVVFSQGKSFFFLFFFFSFFSKQAEIYTRKKQRGSILSKRLFGLVLSSLRSWQTREFHVGPINSQTRWHRIARVRRVGGNVGRL